KIGTSEALCAIRVLIKKLIGRVEALEYNNITDLVPGWPDCLYTLNLIADSVHALTPIGFPAVPTLVEVVEWLISAKWIVDFYTLMPPAWFNDAIEESVHALETIGSPEAVPVLLKAFQVSWFVPYRASISKALIQIGGPAVIDGLRRL